MSLAREKYFAADSNLLLSIWRLKSDVLLRTLSYMRNARPRTFVTRDK